jgi:hypothetical protein
MRRILTVLLMASASIAWDSGDDLSLSADWLPLTQAMRSRSVMNMHDGYTPWFGANWWMSHMQATNTLPNIDPYWWNPNGLTTNGGWVWTGGYTDMSFAADATVTTERRYDFSKADSQNPYIDWYVREAQTHAQNWFNNGRVVIPGTETEWNGSSGGSGLTLQAALELTGMTNGVRRSYEIVADTNVLVVTGALTPDVTGRFTWNGTLWARGDGAVIFWDEGRLSYVLTPDIIFFEYFWVSATAEGTYSPNDAATGEATAAHSDETYSFTNGWASAGDFIGFWQRDDLTNLLSVMRSAWYVPNANEIPYFDENRTQRFIGQESIPLYLRSGSYHTGAEWATNATMGSYDTKVDLIVTNTIDPDCDGYYLKDYLADYGRLDGKAVIRQVGSGDWIIYGDEHYATVSGATNSGVDGQYTFVSPTEYNNGSGWGIREGTAVSYVYPTNTAYAGYEIAVTGAVSPDISGGWELHPTPHKGEWSVVVTNGSCYILRNKNLTLSSDLANGSGTYTTTDVAWPDDPANWGTYTMGGYTWSLEDDWFMISNGEITWVNSSITDPFATYSTFVWPSNYYGTATVERWVKSGTDIFGEYTPDPNSLVTGTAYLIDTSFQGYTNSTLNGTYTGVGDYSGDSCTVDVGYFHRQGAVTGEYANIGDATANGVAEVREGPGWINPTGFGEATEENALLWIAENFSDLQAVNEASMSSFSTPTFSIWHPKGYHNRSLTAELGEEEIIPPDPTPTNIAKYIYISLAEADTQYSPACIVDHKFGNGGAIAAGHSLPAITNANLFTEAGYYTNSFGLTYEEGNKFPCVDFSLIDFPGDRTFFADAYDGITVSNYTDYMLVNKSIQSNFVGWVMEFDVE